MVRPLGLPVGSVRALLLLALASAAIFDLYHTKQIAPWLIAAIFIAGASYFSSRRAGPPTKDEKGRGPWWLPSGTIRLIFIGLLVYGGVVWFRFHRDTSWEQARVAWIVLAYVIGVLTGALERRGYSDEEAGRPYFEHLVALVSLIAAAALVCLSIEPDPSIQGWVPPLLGAVVVHYFATR